MGDFWGKMTEKPSFLDEIGFLDDGNDVQIYKFQICRLGWIEQEHVEVMTLP